MRATLEAARNGDHSAVLPATYVGVRSLRRQDLPQLEEMYRTFVPQEAAMGLPPSDAARRQAWLDRLQAGTNLVGLVGNRLAGHLALMPDGGSGEIAVFVHQDFRRRGVATELVRAALEEGRAGGLRSLWALLSSDNFAARRLLRNLGFRETWNSHAEMQMEFRPYS